MGEKINLNSTWRYNLLKATYEVKTNYRVFEMRKGIFPGTLVFVAKFKFKRTEKIFIHIRSQDNNKKINECNFNNRDIIIPTQLCSYLQGIRLHVGENPNQE